MHQQQSSPKDEAGQPLDLVCQLDAQLRASGLKREVSRFIVGELNNCSELKARIHEQARQRVLGSESKESPSERNRLVREIYETVRPLVPTSIQLQATDMVRPSANELLMRRQRRLGAEAGAIHSRDLNAKSTGSR